MAKWEKKDHTNLVLKATIRRKFLPADARVLDLYCGRGQMYDEVYQDLTASYTGIDRKKIRKEACFIQENNQKYIKENDINDFNVFDLDAYGCPWKVFCQLGLKLQKREIVVFLTDGLKRHLAVGGRERTKIVNTLEGLSRDLWLPSIGRWYVDMFSTMLLEFSKRSGYTVTRALYVMPSESVCYWVLKLRKDDKRPL